MEAVSDYNRNFFKNNKTIKKGYIYLRYQNVVDGKVEPEYGRSKEIFVPISDYSLLFVGNNKVYNNGGSEVWK